MWISFLFLWMVFYWVFFIYFLYNWNSGNSELTSLLVSFLQTPEQVSPLCSTLFRRAWSTWTFMSRLLSSSTRILSLTISLGKTKSSRIASCAAVSAAPGTLLLLFCMAFSSWLRQNSPLSAKDNVRPTELFLPSRVPAGLGFSGKISVEEQEQRLS